MDETELGCRQPGVDPDWWFRGPETYEATHARTLCLHCPAYWECSEYALTEGIPWGIWGGMDGKQRAKIWAGWPNGRPRNFDKSIDAAVRPLLQDRRDRENDTARSAVA